MLSPGVAWAHNQLIGSFGGSDLNNPVGVAVDQASGDVYVGNLEADNFKFDSSGNVLSPPSPFGGGSGLYSGVAVNPTDGDVYVVDAGYLAIDVDDPTTGALLSSFSVPDAGNLFGSAAVIQIATNSAGDVYVPIANDNDIQEYDQSGTLLNTITGSGATALSAPTGVAIDSAGDIWVADTGNNRIEEFDPTGTSVLQSIPSTGVQAVAVNPQGDVYASVTDSSGSHVLEYDSSGTQIDDFGLGTIGTSAFGSLNGIDVNDSTGVVYVADGANNVVWEYAAPKPPDVVEHVRDVSADSATLAAEVNPNGLDTTYHFEWGPSDCSTNTCTSVPVPDGDIGSGTAAVEVTQQIQTLTAGTTYHYRIVATNSGGTTTGPDRTFTTQPNATSGPDTCTNAAFRTGPSASLPDCRAYEQVTPVDKGDGALPTLSPGSFGPDGFVRGWEAAPDGNMLAYVANTPFPGSQAGGINSYVASRTAGGWTSHALIPPQAPTDQVTSYPQVNAYSSDLSQFVLADGGNVGLGQDDPPLVAGEPADNANLFFGSTSSGDFQLLDPSPMSGSPENANFDGASSDLSHVFFTSTSQLASTPVPAVPNLYDWSDGQVNLVSQVPGSGASSCGGTGPSCVVAPDGGTVGSGDGTAIPGTLNAISTDGTKVVFRDTGTNVGGTGNLFVRVNDSSTVEATASHKTNGSGPGGTDPNGPRPKTYQTATPDLSSVFFTSCEQLTNDSTAVSVPSDPSCNEGGNDLYRFDTATAQLTDLTVDSNGDPNGADVVGVVGTSSDGSWVYFVANGVLASGATLGNCSADTGAAGSSEFGGHCNLYLAHNGLTRFIAKVSSSDESLWGGEATGRVTPDGTHLAFTSYLDPTGYDNTPAAPGDCDSQFHIQNNVPTCAEVYLYDATSSTLVCASCNPTGAQPTGDAFLPGVETPAYASSQNTFQYLPHSLSTDGSRLFFDTIDNLAPSDDNGQEDVYEYEDGQAYLISGGTGSSPSEFLDASPSGNDVFFQTQAALVPQDDAGSYDIYDARVDGGFASATTPPACASIDTCRAAAGSPPSPPTAVSVTFSGPGNQTPGKAVRVRVLTRRVRGPAFILRIKVPKRGRLVISGAGVRRLSCTLSRAATYRLRVVLTGATKRELSYRHKVRLRLHVRYAPPDAPPSTAAFSLRVVPGASHSHRIDRVRGGAR